MRSPLLTALGAGTGTFVAMSVVTGLVSAATLKVAKQVVHHRKMKVATQCLACDGVGYLRCQVCMGKGIVRCRQPVPMRLLRRQKPPAAGDPSRAPVMCSCPACGTTRTQRCLSCVGEGKLCLPS
ncbi:hypothetical protein D9Q98_005806 [Chlorella vulgaris]|uniref:Uncharacterized protein n=1 Tax=Chlorella vulgaris TaxID=3077 RepID=A0A9D4TW96_CHLVU|nr:hypothetical protein D9Q98_005806 [Chlorella vulgaris]